MIYKHCKTTKKIIKNVWKTTVNYHQLFIIILILPYYLFCIISHSFVYLFILAIDEEKVIPCNALIFSEVISKGANL